MQVQSGRWALLRCSFLIKNGPKSLRNNVFATDARRRVQTLVIFDNSSDTPNMIAFEKLGQLQIVDSDLFAKLSRNLEAL